MKTFYPLFLLLVLCSIASAQGPSNKKANQQSREYNVYRNYMSEPPYSLAKIKKLVAGLKLAEVGPGEDGDNVKKPTDKEYQALSLREKFTYHMIHAESYYQICDVSKTPDIAGIEKKIFGHLPEVWDAEGETGNNWGERQKRFFKSNKDSVIKFILEDVTRTNRVGLNYKEVIVNINATSMIPFLVDFYKKERKDHEILTVLMLLMENNKDPEFLASISHKKLYAKGNDYDNDYYTRFLVLNSANEDLIMQRAMNFYNGIKKN